ncbi:unnamed protein product [Mesocestoides corti]|uniref:Immunoglobulin I-set domain-containing protein n=1 Tax=Mesocestoides corti TaxID=53468 RepID=A0A0R3U545_MESCO|nr:unnamed protein product [Mesocestoides corti]
MSFKSEDNLFATYFGFVDPPRLEIKNNAVYTELGATEDIAITVYGNPPPELNCDLLNINEPRELELVPGEKQGVRTYHLRLHEVKKQDVGDYKCSAVNELGSSTVTVRLTLSPSPPEVISPKFANHADYYLLGWRSRSKSPLRNVTFRIHSQVLQNEGSKVDITVYQPEEFVGLMCEYRTEKSAGGVDTVELESKGKVKTVSLEDQLVAKANTNASDWQEFWHHISNLSHNSEHRIYLSACNQYGCSNGSSEIPHVTFRTPKDDSSNRIDPALLEHPPSAALLAAASRDFEGLSEPGKDGATWPASVTLLHTINAFQSLIPPLWCKPQIALFNASVLCLLPCLDEDVSNFHLLLSLLIGLILSLHPRREFV